MLSAPSIAPLIPTSHPLPNGNTLFHFRNDSLGIVRNLCQAVLY